MYNTDCKNVLRSKRDSKEVKKSINKITSKKTKTSKKKIGRPTICSSKLEKQVSVKFPKSEFEALKNKADGVPLANYVRRLVLRDLGLK